MKWKIAVCVALAVALQSSLRAVWEQSVYADLALVVVVYFALQRDAVQAVMIGTVAGLGADVLSGGLLGAGGFSMTLTAYLLAALVTRVMIDNPLARIPVMAGAAAFQQVVYFLLHQLMGQPPGSPPQTISLFLFTKQHMKLIDCCWASTSAPAPTTC